jgi:hypothetical protein
MNPDLAASSSFSSYWIRWACWSISSFMFSTLRSAWSSTGATIIRGRFEIARGRIVSTTSNARGITSSDPHSFWASRQRMSRSGGEAF